MRKISGADAVLLIGLFVCCVLAPLSCGARDQMRTVEADECVEVCDGSVRRYGRSLCECGKAVP